MLNDNIKTLRKAKGLSQETLAQQLNIVRQTVSKWENGTSVPDADMLVKLADVLEVSVTELIGSPEKKENTDPDMSQTAMQLYILNEQIAKELYRKKKIRKTAVIILCVILFLTLLFISLSFVSFKVISHTDRSAGDVSSVTLVQCDSQLYSRLDINSAVETVKKYFTDEFNGCRMTGIGYAGDEKSKLESEYYDNGDVDEILVLTSSFYVGKHGGDGSLNTDFQYDEWNWVLGRKNGEEWKLIGNGMA